MNPKLTITVDAKNRALSVASGMITVGAKIDVEISGLPGDIPPWGASDAFSGPSVRFRLVDECGRDLARYPLAEGDRWEQSGGVLSSLTPVEFDTDRLRRAFRGVAFDDTLPFGVIVDSAVDAAQYAVGRVKVRQWAVASTEDPTVLPDWRETLERLQKDLAEVSEKRDDAVAAKAAAVSAASEAQSSRNEAAASASSALAAKNDAEAARDRAEAASGDFDGRLKDFAKKEEVKSELASKADLVGGKVPAAQLPSFVDDVLEYDSVSAFPATDESGRIFVAKDTNLTYRWSGTQYVEISPSLALGETATTAYPGDKGKATADLAAEAKRLAGNGSQAASDVAKALNDHAGNTSNPHEVTAKQVGALPLSGGTIRGNLTLETGSGGGSPTLEVSGVSSAGIKLNAEYGGKITVGHGSNGGGQIVLKDSSVTGGTEAEVIIGSVKVRATLAAKQDKLTKGSAPTVGTLLLMGDRQSNGVSLDVTRDGKYGALAVKGADNRTSVLTPDGSQVLTLIVADARYVTAEALASLSLESIKKTADGAKWVLSANLVLTKTTTVAGEASCTLTTPFGSASLSKIQDRLFSGVLDGIGNVAVWWDGSVWNWGTHPVPSDPTSMQSVSTDPSSDANATNLSFSDGSNAAIALGAGTEVVETSHLATVEAVDKAYVPMTRTINGKPLSVNVALTAADVGAVGSETDPVFAAWKSATNVVIGYGASAQPAGSMMTTRSVTIGHDAKTYASKSGNAAAGEAEAVAIGPGAVATGYGVAIGKGAVADDTVVIGSEYTPGFNVYATPNSFKFIVSEGEQYVGKTLQSFLDLYWKKTDWLVGVPLVEIVSDGFVKCPDYMGTDGASVCFSADGNDIDDTTSRLYPDGSKVMTETLTNEKLGGYATKADVAAKADKTNVYTRAEVDAKVNAVSNKADEAYSAAEQMVDAVNSLSGTVGDHIRDTKNPHKVTAEQVGAYTTAEVDAKIGNAVVKDAENVVTGSFSIKSTFENREQSLSFGGNDPSGPSIVLNKLYSTAPDSFFSGSIALIPSSGEKTSLLSRIKEYSAAHWDARQEVESIVSSAMLPSDPTFSNAVLSVGLNIDTNSVAVLNEIASTFGGFPIEGTATTVGGLLAALAAAVAWLRKNKADKTALDSLAAKVDAANAALEEVA